MALKLVNSLKSYYKSKTSCTGIYSYNAYTMADVYKILEDIGQNVFQKTGQAFGRPLWFRGQEREDFMLIPSLYRERENKENKTEYYSTFSLAEEYRHQNFAARVSHLTKSSPKSRVEWQEVLQHHFGKTRFMDWSESLETAVNFALDRKSTRLNSSHR